MVPRIKNLKNAGLNYIGTYKYYVELCCNFSYVYIYAYVTVTVVLLARHLVPTVYNIVLLHLSSFRKVYFFPFTFLMTVNAKYLSLYENSTDKN